MIHQEQFQSSVRRIATVLHSVHFGLFGKMYSIFQALCFCGRNFILEGVVLELFATKQFEIRKDWNQPQKWTYKDRSTEVKHSLFAAIQLIVRVTGLTVAHCIYIMYLQPTRRNHRKTTWNLELPKSNLQNGYRTSLKPLASALKTVKKIASLLGAGLFGRHYYLSSLLLLLILTFVNG